VAASLTGRAVRRVAHRTVADTRARSLIDVHQPAPRISVIASSCTPMARASSGSSRTMR
jgi:hypothetical protein